MRCVTAHPTAERLLIGAIFAVHVMAHQTFLRRIRALDLCCLHASFGRVPGDLIGNMAKIRRSHGGVHRSGFVMHGSDGKLLVGKLALRMLLKTEVNRSID